MQNGGDITAPAVLLLTNCTMMNVYAFHKAYTPVTFEKRRGLKGKAE